MSTIEHQDLLQMQERDKEITGRDIRLLIGY